MKQICKIGLLMIICSYNANAELKLSIAIPVTNFTFMCDNLVQNEKLTEYVSLISFLNISLRLENRNELLIYGGRLSFMPTVGMFIPGLLKCLNDGYQFFGELHGFVGVKAYESRNVKFFVNFGLGYTSTYVNLDMFQWSKENAIKDFIHGVSVYLEFAWQLKVCTISWEPIVFAYYPDFMNKKDAEERKCIGEWKDDEATKDIYRYYTPENPEGVTTEKTRCDKVYEYTQLPTKPKLLRGGLHYMTRFTIYWHIL